MNFIHFSTSDTGGAGNAAYTLHKNLIENGHNSILFVSNKNTLDGTVVQISNIFLLYLLKIFYKISHYIKIFKKNYYFHNSKLVTILSSKKIIKLLEFRPDFIIIHSISNFVSLKLIYKIYKHFNVPVFWFLMDMAPFTGGCHFSWGCNNYSNDCGNCPAINYFFLKSLAKKNLKYKKKYLKKININIISISEFLLKQSIYSELFFGLKSSYMPLGINDNIFKPVIEKKSIRLLNKVPIDKKIILFSTSDIMEKRKGFDYLLKSLVNIEINKNLFSKELILITFGVLKKEINFKNIKHIHFPYEASVQKRVEIYNLADIFICTSIEDSGPSTLTEVMSCGIPVVAFDTGDAQKYIVNDHNGYKVRLKDVTDLENKIFKIFSLKKAEIDLFSKNSRNFVLSNLNKDKQLKIFKDIILSKNE